MNKENTLLELSEKYVKKLLKKGVDGGVFPGASAGIFFRKKEEKKKIVTCYGNAALIPQKRALKKRLAQSAGMQRPSILTVCHYYTFPWDFSSDINYSQF